MHMAKKPTAGKRSTTRAAKRVPRVKRAHSGGEDHQASMFRGQAYIDYMRPRCVELARVLKMTGSFYYHCDWHGYADRMPT